MKKPLSVPSIGRFATVVLLSFLSFVLVTGARADVGQPPPRPAAAANKKAAEPKLDSWFKVKKPEWLSELSLLVKEFFDSNIYVTNHDNPGMGNRTAWVNSVNPRVGFNFAPLIEDGAEKDRMLKVFGLNYSPEVFTYGATDTESYTNHRVSNQIKLKADAFTFALDNTFLYVDGSKDSPIYPGGVSAVGGDWVRDRRCQIQDRGALSLRYDCGDWFLRPTASILYFDFRTNERNDSAGFTPGYQDYVDRYDLNGGLDLGYRATPDLAAVVGYRYGHQHQGVVAWNPVTYPNDYQRVLGGFEGKPWKWLKTEFLAGPDFRDYYDSRTPATFRSQDNHLKLFASGSSTAELTKDDTLTIRASNFQWLSGTGRSAYEEKVYQGTSRHRFDPQFAAEMGARAYGKDYDFPAVREDWVYTYMAGLRYQYNANLGVDLDYSCDQGVNEMDLNATGREFTRHLVATTVKLKF